MTYEELVAQVRELPLSQRKQLINELVDSLIVEKPQLEKRIMGLNAGSTIFISDDFNDELIFHDFSVICDAKKLS